METLMGGTRHFYQLVYISILSTACCSLSERSLGGPPQNLHIESCNFQHILTWQAKPDPTVPTYYRVLYTDHRNWQTAKQCSNITQLSCNLTDDFTNAWTEYSVFIQSFLGPEVQFNSSILHFAPYSEKVDKPVTTLIKTPMLLEKTELTNFSCLPPPLFYAEMEDHADASLGPPEVNISSCLNCINVTIKLPTTYFRTNGELQSLIDIYNDVDYAITLKTLNREYKRPHKKTTEEVFSTVIEELYPNRNYCVSVTVAASLNRHSIPSAWKCVTAESVAQQDYLTATVAGAVCFSLILAGVLKCMHAGRYIFPEKSFPRTLIFVKMLTYSSWTLEPEDIDSVEVIYREVKKRVDESVGGVSDEDDSDASDSDAISNHDYTRRDIISRVPHSPDTPNVFKQYSPNDTCDDRRSLASEDPDTDPEDSEEHKMDIEEVEDTSSELLNPFSEVNCNYSSRRRNSACFTINLKTVLLGTSEENGVSSAALLSSQEDTHAFESELQDDTESVQKPPCHSSSYAWQNSSCSSSESDDSDSEMDQKTEYIRR